MIDLHIHSTYSDGTQTPSEILEHAHRIGMEAMALTDHDTCDGVKEAIASAITYNIELIPGVELSTEEDGQEIHVVGLFIDPENEALCKAMKEFRYARDHRNEMIVEKLKEQGFDITMEALIKDNPNAVITRANIARFLVDHKQIGSVNHAFDRYLGDDCCCYVPRPKISPAKACELITEAGGLPILAHPVLYHMKKDELRNLITKLIPSGLKGIEVYYSTYDRGQERDMKEIAEEFNLLLSGGSDFHGDNKPYIHLGTGKNNLNIPYSLLEKMKKQLTK